MFLAVFTKKPKEDKSYLFFTAVFAVAVATVFLAINTKAGASEGAQSYVIKLDSGADFWKIVGMNQVSFFERVFPFSEDTNLKKIYRVSFSSDSAAEKAESSGVFKFFEKDFIVAASSVITSDPQFTSDPADLNKQWWLAKMGVPQSWEIATGSKDVVVAVVDTGINGKHEDLSNGSVGSGFLSYCQVQGAGPGQCSVHISTTASASENTDDNGHGTIIAGIIGAAANNAKGIAGINWNIRLMPVKVLDSVGSGSSSDVAAGIVWAVDNGAHVINLSLGGLSLEASSVLQQAVRYAYEKSVLVVAAAGNDSGLQGLDLDSAPIYPVCADGAGNWVLGVTATDIKDKKALFSSYGKCIDIAAPGTTYFNNRDDQRGIISTYYDPKQPLKNNLYVYASGTSMAAPMVSAVAALLKSRYPDLNGVLLRDRLLQSATNITEQNLDACSGKSCSGKLGSGRLDALRVLQTATFLSDSLITNPTGRIYFIENGTKRTVSEFVMNKYGFAKTGIKNVSLSESELLPSGLPFLPPEGTLIKSISQPTVYLTKKSSIHPMNFLAFRSRGFTFDQIAILSDEEVDAYAKGEDAEVVDGALVKSEKSFAVYILKEGKLRLLSALNFKLRNYKSTQVTNLSAPDIEKYALDEQTFLEPLPDGTLVKNSAHPAIYVVEGGKRRALSAEAFKSRNYAFSTTNSIAESELEGYAQGEPIL